MKLFKSILFAISLLYASVSSATLMVWLDPGFQMGTTGDNVTLTLMVGGLGDGVAPSLGAFDVDVNYDSSVLSLTSFSLMGNLGDLGLGEAIDLSLGDLGGVIGIAEISFLFDFELDSLQGSSFALAELNFHIDALAAPDSTHLSLVSYGFSDGLGGAITDVALHGATIGTVPIDVPEPTSLLLMGLGLLALTRKIKV